MNQKFFNDAIIGNKSMRATFSRNGELLRIYYPNIDFKQFIEFFKVGVKINDSGMIYLNEDINNRYHQYYIENTNILSTEIENTYFQLRIRQVDYILLKENVLIRKYLLKNENKMELDINFLVHSKRLSDDNNMVSGRVIENGILQYTHDDIFSIFSNQKIVGHRINDTDNYIRGAVLQDKDYIGMASDSSISYEIGKLKPGEEKEFTLFLMINENRDIKNIEDIKTEINKIKKIDTKKEFNAVKKYWNKYVQDHKKTEIKGFNADITQKIENIYNRTILLFPLLQNEATGGISAAAEIDEGREKSGRYSYCWPRDAVFVTKALDELGMIKETEKFYKTFCKNTQSSNGMWEQRFYTDGSLAPCWGYQIDETASVIYGIWEHYKIVKDNKFLIENVKMCENATEFLLKYLSYIFEETEKEKEDVVKKEIEEKRKAEGKQTDKIYEHRSYDIWEMNEGIHLYSLASIYAAFDSMTKIYDLVKSKYENNRLKLDKIELNSKKMKEKMRQIRKFIENNLVDENYKVLRRNCEDRRMDISMIGAVVPFSVLTPKEKVVQNTVEKINMTLRTYTGGYIRFEQDNYMEGIHPWPIATLWMALYYLQIGEKTTAKECIQFVANTATELGFLGEQVDNGTMKTNWVIGLGWAHAMFILAITKLLGK